ncbi:hypothetical protein [Microvirga yunnanensis]|uniref:hypothetical protein n=1 Tax=Microvirga yunnanensis TaxID=2953740 RepID=UPI0021C9C88C|nr:hypothetical protein [Microvirga sp. HBU65207]
MGAITPQLALLGASELPGLDLVLAPEPIEDNGLGAGCPTVEEKSVSLLRNDEGRLAVIMGGTQRFPFVVAVAALLATSDLFGKVTCGELEVL